MLLDLVETLLFGERWMVVESVGPRLPEHPREHNKNYTVYS